MELEVMIVVAVLFLIVSIVFAVWNRSQGYFDNYGRKIPLDEVKSQTAQQGSEISSLKTQLAEQSKLIQRLEAEKQGTLSGDILQRLSEIEKRLEALEGKL
jgi:hypothetical protein